MHLRGPVALVVNDMINSNLRTPHDAQRTAQIAESGLIHTMVAAVARVRAASIPIFWIQVQRRADRADVGDALVDLQPRRSAGPQPAVLAGSFEGANVEELPVLQHDQVVFKPRMDPFIGTELDILLRSRGIRTILLAGYSTNGGVESAARTAHDLDYDVVVISDCCYNVEVDAHEFAINRTLPFYSRVRRLADIAAAIDASATPIQAP